MNETLARKGWKIVTHHSYHPDLASSDVHFLEPMKAHTKDRNLTLITNENAVF
jgi:hypothetical protein